MRVKLPSGSKSKAPGLWESLEFGGGQLVGKIQQAAFEEGTNIVENGMPWLLFREKATNPLNLKSWHLGLR